jgi:hypothetical protein
MLIRRGVLKVVTGRAWGAILVRPVAVAASRWFGLKASAVRPTLVAAY